MNISDTFNPKGYVEIYKIDKNGNKELYYETNNLIVYSGREWVLSRIFNQDNEVIVPTNEHAIYWVSFGSGGAPVTSPLDPIPPENTDTALASEIIINDTEPTVYADGGRKHPIDNVQFVQDNKNMNRYLIARADVLLDTTEANDQDINEAGLWISDSNDPTVASVFTLFARVTFPTIRKRNDFSIQLLWHIYV